MRMILLLAAVVALAGCKTRWPVSKPGATAEQAQQDIDDCETRARQFTKSRAATARDQTQAYNRLVISCLRDRGYSVAGD